MKRSKSRNPVFLLYKPLHPCRAGLLPIQLSGNNNSPAVKLSCRWKEAQKSNIRSLQIHRPGISCCFRICIWDCTLAIPCTLAPTGGGPMGKWHCSHIVPSGWTQLSFGGRAPATRRWPARARAAPQWGQSRPRNEVWNLGLIKGVLNRSLSSSSPKTCLAWDPNSLAPQALIPLHRVMVTFVEGVEEVAVEREVWA